MTARVELRLTGPVDHLQLVWQVGETLLESVPFREDPEGARYNALLATQEMLTNVLRYAYQGEDSQPVELEMTTDDSGFCVEIRDVGPPFDPVSHPAPNGVGPPDDLRPGGYGIMIARLVMDAVDYRREGARNVLRMRKYAVAPVPAESEA